MTSATRNSEDIPVRNSPGISKRKGSGSRKFTYGVRAYDRATKASVWVGTFDSLEKAREARRKFQEMNLNFAPERSPLMTVEQFAAEWLDLPEGAKPGTKRTYKHGISDFLRVFGRRKLKDLSPRECEQWARDAPPSSVKTTRVLLNAMVRAHVLPFSPLDGFKSKKQPGRKFWPVMSGEDVTEVVDLAASSTALTTKYKPLIAGSISLGDYLGIRESEIFALTTEDIDWDARTVRVERQIPRYRADAEDEEDGVSLKSDFERVIALTDQALQSLRDFRTSDETGFLYPQPDGLPFNLGSFYHHFGKIQSACHIPRLQFHEFRHHLTTWMLLQKIPIWAIDCQLGHETGKEALFKLVNLGIVEAAGVDRMTPLARLYSHPDQIAVSVIQERLAGPTIDLVTSKRRSDWCPPESLLGPKKKIAGATPPARGRLTDV